MNSSVTIVLNDPFLVRILLVHADYDSIINYGRTCVQSGEVCRDIIFWNQKAQHDFSISSNDFKNTTLSPALRYLELLTENGNVASDGSVDFMSLNQFVKRAVQQDRSDLVQYAITLGFKDWNKLTYEYGKKGNKEMVNYYLTLSKNYNLAAEGALEGNYQHLFDYIRSIAVPNYIWKWDELLSSAMMSKNQQLFKYIRSLIPKNHDWDFQFIMFAAIKSDNNKFFYYLMSIIPRSLNTLSMNYDKLTASAEAGNKEIFGQRHRQIMDGTLKI